MMKKVVIAVDSFKGCLTSTQVAEAIFEGIRRESPTCEVNILPIADGGEGTMAVLVEALDGELFTVQVKNPLGRDIDAQYGYIAHRQLAVIELAQASGLTLLTLEERNPLITSTFGVGQLIRSAYEKGCREFIIGLGGSATNDGGMGMLRGLGYRFYDVDGEELQGVGKDLSQVFSMSDDDVDPGLFSCRFTIACDVTNPFSGSEGAAYVYAPQKGATFEMVQELDFGLAHFAQFLFEKTGVDLNGIPGSGAAGGIGGAFAILLHGQLHSGIDIVLDALHFDQLLSGADLVITGEGQIDSQTMMGKAIQGILRRSLVKQVPVIALAGSVKEIELINDVGILAAFSINSTLVCLTEAMEQTRAAQNITTTTQQIIRLLNIK